MDKIKVLLLYIVYPLAMGTYFKRAFQRNENVDLKVCGPYTGSWIPWMGGMYLPEKYAIAPNIPLPFPPNVGRVSYDFVKAQLGNWKPDLVVACDAGLNWIDKPKDGFVATIGTDPHCVSGDTLLATGQGILYAYEASLNTEEIANKRYFGNCKGVVYKGILPTRRFTLETGQYLTCTDDHLVEVDDGKFIEAKDLRIGDTVLMSRGTYQVEEGTDEDYSQGFIVGAFQGDGSFGSSDMIKFTISKTEKETFGKAIKEHLFRGFGIDCATESKHYTSINAKVIQVRRWGLHKFLKSLDLKRGGVPLFVRQRSKRFIGGYVAGLLAADGCSYEGRIQITAKNERLIRELQIILFYFGVISRVRSHVNGLSSFKPGETYWDLYIATGNSCKLLHDLTGNIPGRPINIYSRRRDTNEGVYQYVKIINIEGAVKNNPMSRVGEPVYDVVNSDTESFLANGVSVHNCLDYSHARKISDKFFNMQLWYAEKNDIYLPYAYSKYDHYPECKMEWNEFSLRDEAVEKDTDAVLVGMPYENRIRWVDELRKHGVSVIFENAPVFDEYRELANRARIGLNWSSMNDLNARAFETPAFGLAPVMNRVPDLSQFLVEGVDYFGFSELAEAVDKVLFLKNNPKEIERISQNAYKKIQGQTYDARIETLLKECGYG